MTNKLYPYSSLVQQQGLSLPLEFMVVSDFRTSFTSAGSNKGLVARISSFYFFIYFYFYFFSLAWMPYMYTKCIVIVGCYLFSWKCICFLNQTMHMYMHILTYTHILFLFFWVKCKIDNCTLVDTTDKEVGPFVCPWCRCTGENLIKQKKYFKASIFYSKSNTNFIHLHNHIIIYFHIFAVIKYMFTKKKLSNIYIYTHTYIIRWK